MLNATTFVVPRIPWTPFGSLFIYARGALTLRPDEHLPTLQKRMCSVVCPLQVSPGRQDESRIRIRSVERGVRLHDDEGVPAKNRAKQRVGTVGKGGG